MFRFAGFELDQQRAELRTPDGAVIRLRRKTFDLLLLFASNPGRVLSKQELMAAVWADLHVGEDSLFQCVKELRAALGDERRQLIRAVSGRGYLFDVDVTEVEATAHAGPAGTATAAGAPEPEPGSGPAAVSRRSLGWRHGLVLAAGVLLAAVGAFSIWGEASVLRKPSGDGAPTTVSVQVEAVEDDAAAARMASDMTGLLTEGLAQIGNVGVVVATPGAPPASLLVTAEVERSDMSWRVRARLTDAATGQVRWAGTFSADLSDTDAPRGKSRLVAGLGHELARSLNALLIPDTLSATGPLAAAGRVAIEQATASITQTTPERFRAAHTMLKKALDEDSANLDLQVALAALELRGIQMAWLAVEDGTAAEASARAVLERSLRLRPNHLPTHEAYCRFLNAINEFEASLVACARALTFDPWNGIALYHIGLAQLQLGRFEDALGTFERADLYDTPQVSRWTWMVGAGWTLMLMDRPEEAVSWLQRSIAVTPASGRTHMLLAAAYQALGRTEEAAAAMANALELRPGSTVANVPPPTKNASPVYLEASRRILNLMAVAGLPED